jgi:DNA polymerase III subunit gamma/tau
LIFKRLSEIAAAESIEYEPDALRLVARAAEGSMRDALSLLDQVIAFGGSKLTAEDTRTMLGTLDRAQVFELLEAVAAREARKVIERVDRLDERAPDYREVLAEVASVLQKIALLQAVPDLQLDEAEDIETYKRLAAMLTPEDTQLYYQIAIVGRRDLELAPDGRAGFEMVLLRMLAFNAASSGVQEETPARSTPAPLRAVPPPTQATPSTASAGSTRVSAETSEWSSIVARMNLQGMVKQLAAHCALVGKQGSKVQLKLDAEGEHFRTQALEEKLTQALSSYYGEPVRLEIAVDSAVDTLARQQRAAMDERLQQARTAIDTDPNVRAMREVFGATVQPDSVRPIE